jgi:hypothetical protein
LLGQTPQAADELVDQLAAARLLDVLTTPASGPVRYTLHDLVRLYAREQGDNSEDDTSRHTAIERAAGAALAHVAATAGPPATARVIRWLDDEEPAMVAVVERAASAPCTARLRATPAPRDVSRGQAARRPTPAYPGAGRAGVVAVSGGLPGGRAGRPPMVTSAIFSSWYACRCMRTTIPPGRLTTAWGRSVFVGRDRAPFS